MSSSGAVLDEHCASTAGTDKQAGERAKELAEGEQKAQHLLLPPPDPR
ncbi:hypothetical protein [Micromonospora chersina]